MRNYKILIVFIFIYINLINIYAQKLEGNVKVFALYGVDALIKNKKEQNSVQVVEFLMQHNINAVFGGYDNVDFVQECKKKKIKVYAELGCFQGEKYWNQNPECHPIDSNGEKIKKDEWYCGVCPNQKWLQEKIIKDAESLIKNKKVDGIWLDFIRYPCHWEVKNPKLYQSCFCNTCVNLFFNDLKINMINVNKENKAEVADFILKNYGIEWSQWKCEKIADFVKIVSQKIKELNPKAVVGLFAVPWTSSDYNNAIKNIIAQDFELLSKCGIDIFSPMVYHKMCYKDIQWIEKTTEYFKSVTKKEIVPIIQACSEPTTLSNDEFTSAVKIASQEPSSGVIIFSAVHIIKENKWDSLKNK